MPSVPAATRHIILCADDFGLSDGANRSILQLADGAAISATSCAVDGPAMSTHVAALRERRPRLAVGLHFNLTENPNFPGSRTVPRWIIATYLRGNLDVEALRREVHRQFARFDELFGAPPDFVDGHEHVHQFPLLRRLVLDTARERYGTGFFVRCTWPRHFRGMKAAVIGLLGARSLRHGRPGLRGAHGGLAARHRRWRSHYVPSGGARPQPERRAHA